MKKNTQKKQKKKKQKKKNGKLVGALAVIKILKMAGKHFCSSVYK